MTNRKPLTLKTQRSLIADLVEGFPLNLSEEEGEYLSGNCDRLHREIDSAVRKLLNERTVVSEPLDLPVDYNLPIEVLAKEGGHAWVEDLITSKNYSSKRTGKVKLRVVLVMFGKSIGYDEVMIELDQLGYRPADAHELLTFGIRYKGKQRKNLIIELDTVHTLENKNETVVAMETHNGRRIARCQWFRSAYPKNAAFLAVAK